MWSFADRRVGRGWVALALFAFAGCDGEYKVFRSVTTEWDLMMVHNPEPVPEPNPALDCVIGGGVAVEDFDGDGRLDAFAANHAGAPNAYWRNEGDGRFVERAADAGLALPDDWTAGVSLADYDNDGDRDVFLCNYGPNRLMRNEGDGTFVDVTGAAGLGDDNRCAGGSWADYDNDGHLDLYVANHFEHFDPEVRPPASVAVPDVLYRNRGDGTFEDVTSLLPEAAVDGAGFIATWFDLDNDGDQDLYVAKDLTFLGSTNTLVRNDGPDGAGGWVFTDITDGCGCDQPIASMGVAVGDYNGDGLQDLAVSDMGPDPRPEFAGALWLLRNRGDGTGFDDVTMTSGLGEVFPDDGPRYVGWGVEFID